MPRLNRIVETALYVDDLDRAAAFYEETLGLVTMLRTRTLFAYDIGGQSVLLLFQRGASIETQVSERGSIPHMTAMARCTFASPSMPTSSHPGKSSWSGRACPSRGAWPGTAAAAASISATPRRPSARDHDARQLAELLKQFQQKCAAVLRPELRGKQGDRALETNLCSSPML
jgi:catechol 2,3-dioxygenase-like lactoylglutathione lyase family enzyme